MIEKGKSVTDYGQMGLEMLTSYFTSLPESLIPDVDGGHPLLRHLCGEIPIKFERNPCLRII